MTMHEEIIRVILISFGFGTLASIAFLFITWIIVAVQNIFKKLV